MTAALIALPLLFALSAFFSSAETVLFSLTGAQRARIKSRSPAADRRIGMCLDDKAALFSTLLVGNTFVNFSISTLGYYLLSAWLPSGGWLAIPVMTVLLLLLGEITPKRLALKYTEEIAPLYARMLWFWRAIFTPFNAVLGTSSKAFSPMLARERRALSDGELVSVMESAAEHGEVSAADAEMVEGVLRLSELCANDEMTPRVDIVGYDVDLDEAARAAALASAKHRYLPVFRRTPDYIEGVIDVDTGKIEDALFVPETVTLDDLLATFAKSGKPLAIVMDEYGGTAGIISVNDVLELIVGPGVFQNPKAVKDIQYPCLDRGGINEDSDISVHLVVVGMTQIAYAMATTAAHICHFPNFMTKNKRTKITFIQKDIKREVDFWMGHFNALMDLSYAEYVSWDDSGKKIVDEMKPKPKYISANYSDPKGFLDIEWEFIDAGVEDMNVRDYIRECVAKDGVSEYLSFAFCGHNAEDNVAASLYLPEEVYEKSEIPVFVYQPLTRWVLSTARQATRYSNLYPFGMRTDCFDPQQERLRWAMKIKYLYDHWEDYKSMGTEEELASGWYKKGEQYIKQQSNIYAANSVPVKFRSIGMDLKQRTNLTSHEVEILAEIEHNRWNVERLLNGDSAVPYDVRMELICGQLSSDESVSAGSRQRKEKLRDGVFKHADIAPYDELLSSSKQFDINIVANLSDVIK